MGRLGVATSSALRGMSLTSRGQLTLFWALMMANGANLGFHVIVSRLLEPSAYGAVVALLVVVLVVMVPVSALQVSIVRAIAIYRGQGATGYSIRRLLMRSMVAGGTAAVTIIAISPFVNDFLHLGGLLPVVFLALFVLVSVAGLAPRALLLGEERFKALAIALLIGAAVRLVGGFVFVRLGWGVSGAVAAIVASEGAVLGAILVSTHHALHRPTVETLFVRMQAADAARSVVAFASYAVFIGADAVLARHYLPRQQSGIYGAAATAARAALFVASAVALIAFPAFAQVATSYDAARRALGRALVVVAVLGGATAVTIIAFPHLVISVMFGGAYEGSTSVVGTLVIASGMVGMATVLMYFHLAAGSNGAFLLSPGVAALVVVVGARHGSAQEIAEATLLVSGGVFLLMLVAARNWYGTPRTVARTDVHALDLWDVPQGDVDVSIVVPFYNPGPRLRTNLERLIAALRRGGGTFEIVAVSDGSTDGSEALIADLADVVHYVELPHNVGKGEALRVGLARGRGRYLGFIDADGDLDPELLLPFISLIHLYEPDVVLGSKRHPLSEVSYPPLRRVYSWGYQQVIRVLFRLNIRDTQTGLKLVRRDVVARALPHMLEKRFAFDLELFVVARKLGYWRFLEAPVRLEHQFSSTISARSAYGMLLDTLAIWYRLHILRWYDRESVAGRGHDVHTAGRQLAPEPLTVASEPADVGLDARSG